MNFNIFLPFKEISILVAEATLDGRTVTHNFKSRTNKYHLSPFWFLKRRFYDDSLSK